MILLALLGLLWGRNGTLERKKGYLKLMLIAMALPYLANTAGWLITEMGRQPCRLRLAKNSRSGIYRYASQLYFADFDRFYFDLWGLGRY